MKKAKIFIVGIGMGNRNTLTLEALDVIRNSDCIIGAKRLVEAFSDMPDSIERHTAVIAAEIAEYIDLHRHFKQIAVLMSGDVGFYSGAKPLIEYLKSYDVDLICGISSIVYLCSKLKTSWDDAKIISLHGRKNNICPAVTMNNKTFVLTGGEMSVKKICADLCAFGLNNVRVWIGENLSYENERIISAAAQDFIETDFDGLTALLIVNPNPFVKLYETHGFEDDLFIRGEVPMTKSEVRSVSISKMLLNKNDIIYDIGAGTGSVSIESALIATEGIVYAIEKNETAIQLIKNNAEKFNTKNIKMICGTAPEALNDLPGPDKVFIGGSSGNMSEIIGFLMEKNPFVRIVVNAIALETLTETINAFQKAELKNVEIVQLAVSKAKTVGAYHMMTGQNPIFIISGGGKNAEKT